MNEKDRAPAQPKGESRGFLGLPAKENWVGTAFLQWGGFSVAKAGDCVYNQIDQGPAPPAVRKSAEKKGRIVMYQDMMDTIGFIEGTDPALGAAMQQELEAIGFFDRCNKL